MENIIQARGLTKHYHGKKALSHIDLDIQPGKIIGFIGPNGAGKTTLLKAILGLTPYDGELEVLGMHPKSERTRLLQDVCFIADTAILPRWMKVHQVITYMESVHEKFDRQKAEAFIAKTDVSANSKIAHLSKGMTTQLHLALIMAIDAKLLVLDEPTLGLDILHRKEFYRTLLGEYFDHEKTIIITTHQVEEIENILTDIIFIKNGRLILNMEVDAIPENYVQVNVEENNMDIAREWQPMIENPNLGGAEFIYNIDADRDYHSLGKTKIPSIADLFLAKVSDSSENAHTQEVQS